MRSLVVAFAFLLTPIVASADDWPQFRGPDRSGHSKEKGLLRAWPKGGPKLEWTFKNAGLAHSSMAVSKGVVYTLGTDEKLQNDIIIAIDEGTGKQLWTTTIGPMYTYKGNTYGDGPRSTPTVDGNLLFALGGMGDLVCVDVTQQGKVLWRKNMVADLGSVIMEKYGYSEAPLVDGDLLICTPGGPGGTLAALEKATGKVVWRSKAWKDMAPYSSAVVADFHGVRQVIQTGYVGGSKGGVAAGVNIKTGDVLWVKPIFTGQSSEGISPSPVIVPGNRVFATSGFGGGSRLFEIGKNQAAEEKFPKSAVKKFKNNHGGVILMGNHIYGHSEPSSWMCQDLETGVIEWNERNVLPCKSGSVIAADGLAYLYNDEGEAGLVELSPKGVKLISSFKMPEASKLIVGRVTSRQARIWAQPVIANGHLYLRDHEFIFKFKIK